MKKTFSPPPEPEKRSRQIGGKTRVRSEESHTRILSAAMTLLDEKGYARLTIDEISLRSGSAKTTIYRWWNSKAEIVLDGYIQNRTRQIAIPAEKNFEQTLLRFVVATCAALKKTSAGPAMAALMAEAQSDPRIAASFRGRWIANRRVALQSIFQRGLDEKRIRPGVDLELAVDLIYGPIWYRLLNAHQPLNRAFAQALVEAVLASLR